MPHDDTTFRFKQFAVSDCRCGMKVGTDGVLAGILARTDVLRARICDVGTGCGIIALMLAQRFPHATIDAVEIDKNAFQDLQANIARSPWAERVKPVNGTFLEINGCYDLIVSNPPFFTNGDASPSASRAAARHADSLSADSLVDFAPTRLTAAGRLAIILPSADSERIIARAAFNRLTLSRRIDIITSARRGITRSFLEFTQDSSTIPEIRTLDMASEEFKSLASDFYLNL